MYMIRTLYELALFILKVFLLVIIVHCICYSLQDSKNIGNNKYLLFVKNDLQD